MDPIRYITCLAIFLATSLILTVCAHLVLLRHTKRKHAALSNPEQ